MPDDSTPSPETPPPYNPARRVGTGLAGETTRNEGSTILPEARQRPMDIIGDFEVLAKLGQGGMGAVYRARQISLDRQVALKILPSNFEADADYVSRFQREARIAASLSHANLVRVYSSGLADGCHYIAMELVEGETLGQWVKRAAVPPLEALRIILDVARALECGWRTAQLIHRDIKPGNIFLSVHGGVKLGDLGLAKIVGSDSTGLTNTGTAMGTPHYISPEQARGDKDLDFRADIYSLGCTLYQMLTGRTPYSGHDPVVVLHHHINSPPPTILKVMPECPLPLARLVSKMLKKQRRERPVSYEELIAQVESVRVQLDPALATPTLPATSAPEPVTPAAPLPPPAAPPKSKLAIYGGIAVVVLAVAAFFLWPKEEKLTGAQRYAREHATELKAAAGAESALASATKDTPFVNTLGMKFVPVPVIGGPTGGQRVLFSVWDTRVQDYEIFAKETKRDWPKPDFEQGPTHPAVMVSWEDANDFCAWLTARERNAGTLEAGRVYRLPTDHEWSCAVGIGEREDAAELPSGKSQKIDDTFPWGTQWPPPAGSGNYAGEELRPALTAGKYNYMKDLITGYNDGFENTSPVGSFPANRFGLFDLGGNVMQWCEDWYDKEQKDRSLRGAIWNRGTRYYLLSSLRDHSVTSHRSTGIGFRCVLAPSAPAAKVSATSYPQPRVWIDDTERLRSGLKDGSLVADGDWLVATKDLWPRLAGGRTLRDCAVRVVFSNGLEVHMRHSDKRYYSGHVDQHASIGLADDANRTRTDLKGGVDLPPGYVPEEAHELVFAVQGEQLSLWLDGKELADARDTTLTAGNVELFLTNGTTGFSRIKKVEYGELEAPGVVQPPAAPTDSQTTAAFPPGQWVVPVADLSKMPYLAEFKDGWARLNDKEPDFYIRKPQSNERVLFRNAGIRVRRQVLPQLQQWHGGTQIVMVRRAGGDEMTTVRLFKLLYFASNSAPSQGTLAIYEFRADLLPPHATDAQNWAANKKLAGKEIPLQGTEFTAELIAIGNTLVGRINDQTVTCNVEDGNRTGGLAVLGTNKIPFRDLEVLNLDGLSEAEALKLAGGSASSAASSPAFPASTSTTAAYPQPHTWIDATERVRSAGLKDGSLVADGEWLEARKTCWPTVAGGKLGDVAVRILFSHRVEVQLRHFKDSSYNAGDSSIYADISVYHQRGQRTSLAHSTSERTDDPDAMHELVFAAQGDQLSLWLDGKEVVHAKDATLTAGSIELALYRDAAAKPPRIKKVEYGELEAPGVAQPSATPIDPRTTAAFPPSQWVKPIADLSKMPYLAEFKEGWARFGDNVQDFHIRIPQTKDSAMFHNAGVRVRRQAPLPGKWTAIVAVRRTPTDPTKAARFFELMYRPKSGGVPDALVIEEFLLPPHPTEAQSSTAHHELVHKELTPVGPAFTAELIAIGKTLVGRINDQTITCILDDEDWTGGLVVMGTNKIPFRDLEVLNLDGLSEAEALKLTGGSATSASPSPAHLSPSAEPWQDVLHDPAKLYLSSAVQRTPDGLRFTDAGEARPHSGEGPKRDGAVRMRASFGGLRPALRARRNDSVGDYQLLAKDEKVIRLGRYDKGANRMTFLREFPLREPLKPGQDYELELRIVGQTLTAALNGEVLGTVTEGTVTEGDFGVFTADHNAAPVLVKALEVLNLDAPGGTSAMPASATKDLPFVNTLGMKFVPVPIIGGPTTGQRVLFSVWDTRVQDYEVFATETKREWPKAGFEQGPTHPAVNVSWEDAQAFCAWLTERERKSGKLGATEVYRLPSDYEWSCAVGISAWEDAAKLPIEKQQKVVDAYPWGTQWPPPTGAGNYAGEELRPALATGKYPYIKEVIAGYRDDFAETSPVGSFAANRFGLYDMGGNVWQWCADWYEKEQKNRALRGASWSHSDRTNLLSSHRHLSAPGSRSLSNGFRCVLGGTAR